MAFSLNHIESEYQLIYNNGQRIYRSENLQSGPPPRGCEVFVGNLPRDLYESELLQHFITIGPIYSLRLMMDFSNASRGFAFVTYFKRRDTLSAIKAFDNFEIRTGAHITVHLSLDNRRLFLGHVPRDLQANDIHDYLNAYMEGIVEVIAYQDPVNPPSNRGFAFVEFESHGKAAIARRQVLAGVYRLWGDNRRIYVDWSDPEPIVSEDDLENVTVLYVSNVPISCESTRLKNYLNELINGIPIMRFYKKNGYAFVHFATREDAAQAIDLLNQSPITIGGCNLKIDWARPRFYSKDTKKKTDIDHFCVSVPPKIKQIVQESKERFIANIKEKKKFNNKTSIDSLGVASSSNSSLSPPHSSLSPDIFQGPSHWSDFEKMLSKETDEAKSEDSNKSTNENDEGKDDLYELPENEFMLLSDYITSALRLFD